MTLPQAAVALVSGGEDMGRQLTQAVLSVQLYGIHTVQTWDGFVGVYWCQDGTNVCLRGKNKTQKGNEASSWGKQKIMNKPDPEISHGEGESLNKDTGLQQRAAQFGKDVKPWRRSCTAGYGLHTLKFAALQYNILILLSLLN